MHARRTRDILKLFCSFDVIVDLFTILRIEIDGMRMAKTALCQQMAQCNDLMVWPFALPSTGMLPRQSNLITDLHFVQLPPTIKCVEWMVGRCFNRASQRCCQTIDRFNAVVHHR